ncbi:glycosyltransferase family 2 protein [bacterium]|nr:glycosyltransferase family 2 protein [bacterium]
MARAPVTVVVPTYNSGHLITDAINSLLAQTAQPEEIVVVDDGSTDDTAGRLAAYGSQIRYHRQPNRGVSAARNLGLRHARSELVAFLDADDVWHPRKLQLQLDVLHRRHDLGLLGTCTYPWPAPDTPDVPEQPAVGRVAPVSWERLVVRNTVVTSSMVVRRSILNRVGEFDCLLQGPEDHDLWVRAAEVAGVANLELPLTGYRDTPASLGKQARRMEAGMRRIVAKVGERGGWRNRGLLRRKAYSIIDHRCAFMYSEAGEHAAAVWRSIRSLAGYPWPYRPEEQGTTFERGKRLVRSVFGVFYSRPRPPVPHEPREVTGRCSSSACSCSSPRS